MLNMLLASSALAIVVVAALPAQAHDVRHHQVSTTTPVTDLVQAGSDANSAKSEAVERLALRILATPAVKQGIAQGLETYRTSSVAQKPEALRHVRSAVDNVATLAALYSAMGAAPEPSFVWLYAPPRRWHGYTLPGSRWYADNVDAIYRSVRVDEGSSYTFTLRPAKALPTQLSFMMYDFLMHERGLTARTDIPLGSLEITDATPRNPDGSITLTAGPDPANGRSNHLQLKPGVRQIFVREIRGDGSLPAVQLAVKRTAGPIPKARTLDELSAEAANYIAAATRSTLVIERVFGQLIDNQVSPLRVRWIEETGSPDQQPVTATPVGPDKALGFVGTGLFNLKEDEALVLTLNMLDAKYLSVNAYRPFELSPEHVYRTSSLNNYQAKANPDGSITFVFARKDPGVHNWIDAGGIPFGEFAIRWQTLTRPVSGTLATGVQVVKTVKLADLKHELPPTTVWITPAERAAQREARARQFAIRCLGVPCEMGGALDAPY